MDDNLPRKGRPPAADPRRNAGIGLTQAEIDDLDEAKIVASLGSRSEVVQLLIKRYLPMLIASGKIKGGKSDG
jgi:hypothetical protein